jgi:hypothetical protein
MPLCKLTGFTTVSVVGAGAGSLDDARWWGIIELKGTACEQTHTVRIVLLQRAGTPIEEIAFLTQASVRLMPMPPYPFDVKLAKVPDTKYALRNTDYGI